MTKRERERERQEAWESIREPLAKCGPHGSATLEIRAVEFKSSKSGTTGHIEIRVWEVVNGRPEPTYWLTRNVAVALGIRFDARRETLTMGGYGYCRSTQIASHLAQKAGHPLMIRSINFFAGPNGWYPRPPEQH